MTKIYLTLLLTLCIAPLGCRHDVLTDTDREAVRLAQRADVERLIVSEQEKEFLLDPQGVFWNDYLAKGRFNEESCSPTNRPWIPIDPTMIEILGVKDGDVIERDKDSFIHILETPGLNPRAISYWYDTDEGHRIANTGSLILGDGRIANIYDLQDNFPVAEIGPYHGFMARTPQLIDSLEKIRAFKPDVLLTGSYETIENPNQAIDTLTTRLRAVYRNYLSTCALWWYFGEKRMNASAVAILGDDYNPEQLDRMPLGETFKNPDWLTGLSTTRMIRSETGDVFVMDVNSDREAEQIIDMHRNGEIKKVTGIFVTHYHHDHVPGVPKLAEFFSAPIYGLEKSSDILERPGAYRMPCLDKTVVAPVVRKNEDETMRWNEFEFTFFDFPGQTLYHNALLVRKGNERPIFFIGDSFTPTGIDDYCAWNRNFLQDGKGYLYCIDKIRSLDPLPLLVNAHVEPPFELDVTRLDYIERALRERMTLLADLLAVPEINFGLDHDWCRFDPFVSMVKAGESTVLKVVITNHFQHACTFHVELEPDTTFPYEITSEPIGDLTIEAGKELSIAWTLKPTSQNAGTGFISAKVTSDDGSLTGRCEAAMQWE